MATTFSGFRIFNPGAAPLIASLCRICKVQETIDQMVQWRETARLSPGQVAEAIIINILCGRRPLWKMVQFFDEIDLSLLYGNGISPEHLNDDVLGRCLDKLGEIDLDKLVSQVGLQALLEHSLALRVVHIDSTSVSVEGEYTDQYKDADFLINHGHSKDRRNDLKQFKLGLACQELGMIVGGQLLNGNASDKVWNPQMIDEMHLFFQSKGQDGTIFVIDSAGVSKDTLAAWHEKKLRVISRFPETFNLAEEIKTRAWQEQTWNSIGKLANNKDGAVYQSRSYMVEVEGTPGRLIVVHSSALDNLKQKTLQRRLEGVSKALEKEIKKLTKISFACEPDANEAMAVFLRNHKDCPYQLTGKVTRVEEHKHAKRGRPKVNEIPEITISYQVQVEIADLIQEHYDKLLKQESTFILVTTLPEKDYPDEFVLKEYKEQNSVESRFRFIKQPAYLGPIYLKSPQRVKSLGYLFVLALMIGSYLEYRVRSSMEQENESVIMPGKKQVSRPSLNTMLEFFGKLKTARFRTDNGFIRQWPENLDPQVVNLIRWAGFDPEVYLRGLV